MSTRDISAAEMHMDPDALYREEVFTDQKIGTIRRLTPVDTGGSEDPARPVLYIGQAQLLTPMGTIPLAFEIEAASLAEAVANFAAGAEVALERTAREIEEARREAASSIVLPQAGRGGGFGGPAGGVPGGGLQLP